MTRFAWTTLVAEIVLAFFWGAFIVRPTTLICLFVTLSLFVVFILWLCLFVNLFFKQTAKQRLQKSAILVALPIYLTISTQCALALDNWFFARTLPRYQNVVNQITNGSLPINNGVVKTRSKNGYLAYLVWASHTGNVWTITFFVGAAFPVKHFVYIYKSDDKWTNADWKEWSSYRRRAPHWFQASD